jgi:hypothetical protein
MPTFEIEQYGLHVLKYRVEAGSEASAVAEVLTGTASPADNGLKFVEIAEDFGLPAEEKRELADALRDPGVRVDVVIPSIGSIVEVDGR